jgi:UDP-N-acetylmuramate--alanine ligase
MDKYYFIGIGGIGMSAIARCLKKDKCLVAGFDRTQTPLTCALQSEGIPVHYTDSEALIPNDFKDNSTNVIYTPAVGIDNAELQYFERNGNPIIKRAAALGHIAQGKDLLAVAGTHGKTTTSTMLAHILTHCGISCTAFLGGISKNYGTNFILPPDGVATKTMVAEADEYDRSFLQLHPFIAVITSMDADHLDIYGNLAELQRTFCKFAGQVRRAGALIVKKTLVHHFAEVRALGRFTYSCNEEADFYAKNITPQSGGRYNFDIATPFGVIDRCTVGAPGIINVENAVAAVAAAVVYRPTLADYCVDGSPPPIIDALRTFSGVQRRLDVQVNTPHTVYIDDYAHHPAEITAAIASVRGMFPNRRITGIFQPHLYSRTRDFAAGFAESLSALDQLILLPIYPAREEPIEGVTSQIIFDSVNIKDKQICPKDKVVDVLAKNRPDVLLTIGAGDIDTLVEPLKTMLLDE